jgi:hypothetical protein
MSENIGLGIPVAMKDRTGSTAAASQRSAASGSEEEGPSILSMVGFVAASVAITILVFFGIGYVFGRLFL